MTGFSAAEILARHNIAFRQTRTGKYSTACPDCNEGYLDVKIDGEGVRWHCQSCKQGDGEYFEQHGERNKPSIDFNNPKAVYDYVDESGRLLFQSMRFETDTGLKKFKQRTGPDQKKWSIKGVRIVPYRLPELVEDVARGSAVFVVEGEKDVETLRSRGIPATCNPMGAKKWRPEFNRILAGADVVICGDHDDPGREHVALVARNLRPVVKRLRVLDLASVWPEIEESQDISDWFAAGLEVERLFALVDGLPDWTAVKANGHDERPAPLAVFASDARPPAFSDEALALRFAERHAFNLRFVAAWGKWLSWAGDHWEFDDTLHAYDLARQICREVAAECNKVKIASAIASAKTVAAVERLARADRRLAATVDQWDADPWTFNTPDGVIDLRTGRRRVHNPDEHMTKIAAVGPHGDCPRFLDFLARITNGDVELVAYIRRMLGYALTGETREHALFFAHGTGANGKSVLLSTVSGILGSYHRTASIETFVASNVDRHPTDLAGLRGARLVTAVETEEGRRWAESRIKQLTGGDMIAARFMRQDFFEYRPTFKLVIAGNHKPSLRSVDEAIRRRFHMIPFAVTIPPEERDGHLTDKLKDEWPGILQWIIEGCLDWQTEGLAAPQAVRNATTAYLEAEDALAAWIDDKCERDLGAWEQSSALFASWVAWATTAGEFPGSMKRFTQTIESRGFVRHKMTAGHGFYGLRVIPQSTYQPYWNR